MWTWIYLLLVGGALALAGVELIRTRGGGSAPVGPAVWWAVLLLGIALVVHR